MESLLRKGAAWILKTDDAKSEAFCAADIDTILQSNTRTINSEAAAAASAVGAASARSGLGSFTHATFNSAEAGEVALDFNDPHFWDKIQKETGFEGRKSKHGAAASKREHRQRFDLSRPGGRGDAGEEGDWDGIDSGSEHEGDDDDDPEKKKRRRRGAEAVVEDEDVEFDEPNDVRRHTLACIRCARSCNSASLTFVLFCPFFTFVLLG